MEDTKKPVLILVILFVIIGFAYNPLKNANLNKNGGPNNTSSIGGADNNSGYPANKKEAEEIKNTEADIKKLKENLNKKIDESKHSPHYGKIRMSNISGLYGDDPNQEYIYLSSNLNETETLKITDWYLKSEMTGYFAYIGKAALLPFPFAKTESNVVLEQGDRVYLTKGFSPIGISFRTNKCTGFFEEDRTFTPNLSLDCPRPVDEKLPNFSSDYDRNDECVNIIKEIPRCKTVNSAFIRDLPDTVTDSCKTYMTDQINYNFCVAKHFSDTDFPGNEYHVYLNKFGPLWRKEREKITLYDQNGLVVDSISY